MNTQQIEQFVAIARSQSMTAAAKKLGVSQPSLSQTMKKLEESLGVALFERAGKSLVLNEHGTILLAHADIALRAIENATREIRDTSHSASQTIRLISRCPLGHIANALEEYHEAHPAVLISNITPAENTMKTDWDIEILASSTSIRRPCTMPICNERFVVCVPKRHRLAQQRSLSLKDLGKEAFIMSAAESDMNSVINDMFLEAGYRPKVRAWASVFTDIVRMVEEGLGICIATDTSWFIGSESEVAILPIDDVHRTRTIYISWPEQAYLSQPVIDLIHHLSDKLRKFSDDLRLQETQTMCPPPIIDSLRL